MKETEKTGDSLLLVSSSPHLSTDDSIPDIMHRVSIALLPTSLVGIYIFGFGAAITILTAIISAIVFESLYLKWTTGQEGTISDGSALLTGLLLGLNLPGSIPWWATVAGSFFAIIVVKQLFGGLGFNIFNPALAARVFLLISWPVQMTSFPKPKRLIGFDIDALSQATPLTSIKTLLLSHDPSASVSQLADVSWTALCLGNRGGSIGEVSIIALLIGGAYLLYRGTITWHIPFSFIFSTLLFSALLKKVMPLHTVDPVFHILNGGLMLGALFMASDYVTSPITNAGMIIFGMGCGFLTILIRQFGGYPEGVSFAILIMNMFVPIIDRYVKPARFGAKGLA